MKIKKDNSDLYSDLIIWGGFAALIALLIFLSYKYIVWTDGNLEYFVSYLKDRPVKIPFWVSAIIVCLTNVCTLLFNIICEIVKS